MDPRLQQLSTWLSQQLTGSTLKISPVSGDASFRRYFRIEQHTAEGELIQWIAMDAPPEKENSQPFVAIDQHWVSQGIQVPHIEAHDLSQGFMLLADFGDQLMLKELDPSDLGYLESTGQSKNETPPIAEQRYQSALKALKQIQQCSEPESYKLPAYDKALLSREMELFREWLVVKKLGIKLTDDEKTLLDDAFQQLINAALGQPTVCVHRDYHSRNLMVLNDQSIGILDFQDAVMGPITYDAVSLLRDCYIALPPSFIDARLMEFHDSTGNAGLHNASTKEFRQWFDLMGIQRHLKAAGIFARLSLRDGKHSYLNDIPRTIGYIEEISANYPQLRTFHNWLCARIMPSLKEILTTEHSPVSNGFSETG